MFSLPAIGVSACARTIGHATSSSRNSEANLHIMRARVVMSMTAAMRQHPFFASGASHDLPDPVFRSLHTQHDSVRGRVTLSAARLGPRPAMHKELACFAGRVLDGHQAGLRREPIDQFVAAEGFHGGKSIRNAAARGKHERRAGESAVIPSLSRDLGRAPPAGRWSGAEMFRLRRCAPPLNMTGRGCHPELVEGSRLGPTVLPLG